MTAQPVSSRRSFLKGGALVAAPLIATGVADGAAARLAQLESEAAIRASHAELLRHANAGDAQGAARLFAGRRSTLPDGVRAISSAEPPAIDLAADGRHALVRQMARVEIETILPADCSLTRMAHAQGSGCFRQSEQRMLTAAYVRTGKEWVIDSLSLAAV